MKTRTWPITIAGGVHFLLRRSGVGLLGLLLLFLLPNLFLQAQDYAIDWYTIDGGGGRSSGGLYTVSGTVGQPDAGRMTGGDFTLVGGFWSVVTAVQSPQAPWLIITQTNGLITVSWPLSASGFLLQEKPALDVSMIPWTVVPPGLYQTNAADIFLQMTAPMGNRFYRLQKP